MAEALGTTCDKLMGGRLIDGIGHPGVGMKAPQDDTAQTTYTSNDPNSSARGLFEENSVKDVQRNGNSNPSPLIGLPVNYPMEFICLKRVPSLAVSGNLLNTDDVCIFGCKVKRVGWLPTQVPLHEATPPAFYTRVLSQSRNMAAILRMYATQNTFIHRILRLSETVVLIHSKFFLEGLLGLLCGAACSSRNCCKADPSSRHQDMFVIFGHPMRGTGQLVHP